MSTNRNRMIGGFEDAFEHGKATVQNSVKTTTHDFAKTAKNQVVGDSSQQSSQNQGTNEAGSAKQNSQQSQMTDEERVEFLSNLYGKNDANKNVNSSGNDQKKPQNGAGDVKQALGIPQKDPNEGKTPEEIAKIEALRKQLHSDYYQNLVNRPKPKEEPVAQKLEREEQEERMAEIEEEKKKPKELPRTVRKGTGESVVGVAG